MLAVGPRTVCCACPMRLRVLLADDHPEMMTALAHLIEPACEIVGRIADGAGGT